MCFSRCFFRPKKLYSQFFIRKFGATNKDLLTKGVIRQAAATDISQVSKLRLTAYQTAKEFVISDPRQISWNAYDEKSVVLVACNLENQALATMRASILFNRSHMETYFKYKVPLTDEFFPTLYLERAATCPSHYNSGLNTALRYYFLSLCNSSANIAFQSITGSVYNNAPRISLMSSLGYEFQNIKSSWATHISSREDELLALLPRCKFQVASTFIQENFSETLATYPWQGKQLEIDPSNSLINDLLRLQKR